MRRTCVLAGGTAAAQVAGAAAAPLLARLYSPADFGVFGIYTAVLGIGAAALTWRYEFALPLTRDEREAAAVVALCAVLAAAGSGVAGAALWAASRHWPQRFGAFGPWLPLVSAGLLAGALYQTLALWSVRRQRFRVLASTKLTQAAAMLAVQTAGGLLGLGPLCLVAGHLCGQGAGIGALWRSAARDAGRALHSLSRREMRAAARRYRRFAAYSTPAALLDALGGYLPLIFLATRYGAALAGCYTMVQRLFAVPSVTLATAVGQVNLAEMSEVVRTRRGSLPGLLRRRAAALFRMGALATLAANAAALLLIPPLFGPAWKPAVTCVQILSPMFLCSFVASPLGFAVDVTERQDLHILRELFRVTVMGGTLAGIAVLGLSWTQALWAISAAGVVNAAGYTAVSLVAVRQNERALVCSGYG